MKRTDFEIALRGGGTERRAGYVIGDWAAHKEPGRGVYFWSFTHVPTGMSANIYPPADRKDGPHGALKCLRDISHAWETWSGTRDFDGLRAFVHRFNTVRTLVLGA